MAQDLDLSVTSPSFVIKFLQIDSEIFLSVALVKPPCEIPIDNNTQFMRNFF